MRKSRKSSKIKRKNKKVNIRMLPQVDPDLQEKGQQMDTYKKTMKPCY